MYKLYQIIYKKLSYDKNAIHILILGDCINKELQFSSHFRFYFRRIK